MVFIDLTRVAPILKVQLKADSTLIAAAYAVIVVSHSHSP